MEGSAAQGDVDAFGKAVFEFSAHGLAATNNPILTSILSDLLPAVKRIQHVALLHKKRNMTGNLFYFKTLIDCIDQRKAACGVDIIREYITNERDDALEAIKS
ncbi:MAG: FCD domain-containing protein [Proteobacteria bacterium]|nr:FCD domain-containing protein [Pseudomonadota bacterium]